MLQEVRMKRYLPLVVSGVMLMGAVAGLGGSVAAAHQPSVFTTISESHPVSPGSPINPFNPTGNSYDTYDSLQMAYYTYSPTNVNSFWPALAQKWQASNGGSTVTVWIQPNAKWSNGQPVTAQDFVTSAAVWFTQGDAQYYDLGSVKVINSKEVQFSEIPGKHYMLFEHYLMQQTIVPASYWASKLPKNIWTIINQANSSNTKVATKANNELTNVLGKKIVAEGPSKDISAGPFVISKISPAEVLMVKNPYFYEASKIKTDEVAILNYTGNQAIWNYQIAGRLDYTPYTSMPTNVLNEILSKKGNEKVTAASYVAAGLAFNQDIYPYGNILVRWAIAHVINRQAVQTIGEPVSGSVSQWSDGMVDQATLEWLPQSVRAKLNPYRYNPGYASYLLRKAHFHKNASGQWIMPNGKPFTATIYTVNGFSDWIAAAHVMASELTSFGIPTQPQIVSSYSTFLKQQAADQYGLSFDIMALGPEIYTMYHFNLYGAADGYSLVGGKLVHTAASASNPNNTNFLDTPVTLKVPGVGFVNPGKLTNELSLTNNPKQQQPIVEKLALATNHDLPVYTLWNYILVEFVNTSRFNNFPVHNGGLLQYGAGLWMMQGYVQPK
jgi:peptide/nickel transport system substrate-binding protein